MKTIQLMIVLLLGLVMAQAQDAAPAGEKVSSLEIGQLVDSTKLAQWAELARKSTFGSPSKKSRRVAEGESVEFYENWDSIYVGNSRKLSSGWSAEKKEAEAMLLRPTRDDQRRWLVKFIAACDALAAKDAAKFKELVPALAEDYRTLL